MTVKNDSVEVTLTTLVSLTVATWYFFAYSVGECFQLIWLYDGRKSPINLFILLAMKNGLSSLREVALMVFIPKKKARQNHLIQRRKVQKNIRYCIESIHRRHQKIQVVCVWWPSCLVLCFCYFTITINKTVSLLHFVAEMSRHKESKFIHPEEKEAHQNKEKNEVVLKRKTTHLRVLAVVVLFCLIIFALVAPVGSSIYVWVLKNKMLY